MYPRHAYLTFGGRLGGTPQMPAETWSSGIRIAYDHDQGVDSDLTPEQARTYLTDRARPALETMWASTNLGVASNVTLDWVKFNAIGPDGKYLSEETVEHRYASPGLAAGGTHGTAWVHTAQVALAVTLETDGTTRFAKRGRMFLPGPKWTVSSGGVITESNATLTAGVVRTFVNSLKQDPVLQGPRFTPSIVSKSSPTSGNGTVKPIVAVSVDTRLDIIRSRGRDLPSTRVRQAL